MAGTRSSARLSQSSPDSNKRKAEEAASPPKANKKGKTANEQQQTLEETLDNGNKEENKDADGKNGHKEMEDVQASNGGETGPNEPIKTDAASESAKEQGDGTKTEVETGIAPEDTVSKNGSNDAPTETNSSEQENGKPASADSAHQVEPTEPTQQNTAAGMPTENKKENDDAGTTEAAQESTNDGAIEESEEREQAQPSNILEKGIIYFFTRGRVGVDDLESVQDLQRSHFVLRPIPDGAKLGDGAIDDLKNARLMALPKKVWPKSAQDKFMAFVEKAGASVKELKDEFFQGSEYSTKTVGVRQTPAVTPIGEGVYAITSTGNRGESHIAYMLTVPQEPGQMQEDVGIRSKGSFLISLKNPEVKGPANASLPQKPDWPKEFIDEFSGRSWMPAEPKHLDYANAQILMIGESFDDSHALDASKKDEEDDKKETPLEELEKLENEDHIRIKHLKGDDSIFVDLQISKKDYPDVKTTW